MTRLPNDRDTHLTPEEVIGEALRQFDAGGAEPSIRSLAGALHVTPSAIYHHFGSRAAIVDGCVERVWLESMEELLALEPEPLKADPAEVLVLCGIATRRAWLRHFHLSPYLAASPEANEFIRSGLLLMGNLFGRMGLEGRRAAVAFHSYMTFMVGSVLFAAGRAAANARLAEDGGGSRLGRDRAAGTDERPIDPTRDALEKMMDVSIVDPDEDGRLYEDGLRRLVAGLVA